MQERILEEPIMRKNQSVWILVRIAIPLVSHIMHVQLVAITGIDGSGLMLQNR